MCCDYPYFDILNHIHGFTWVSYSEIVHENSNPAIALYFLKESFSDFVLVHSTMNHIFSAHNRTNIVCESNMSSFIYS